MGDLDGQALRRIVDVLDGQVHAGDLGRAESCQRAGLGEDGADL
ncbi:hypothetical protein SDC9_179130 [bioreactor metagenome]|uniref:Uncharacterized protein n=1 Tax=bioreactor metagenome TaxID=1076179 RepID=A0A645GZJ7_9ZZZZ